MSLRQRLQLLFEGDPNRSGSRIGWWMIVATLGGMVGWTVYATLFMAPYTKPATTQPITYTSSTAPELSVPAEAPPPPPPPPLSLPQQTKEAPRERLQPRPAPQPKQESEEAKCRRVARLRSNYSGPFEQTWRTSPCGGNGNGNGHAHEATSNPGQVMEIPSATQARNGNAYANGNGNVWKNDFYNRGNGEPGVLQPPQSPFMVMQGSVIPVALAGDFDTQTPGQICAKVIQDIKDSRTGRYTMIPKSATVCGGYDINLPYDQNRVPTAWNILIMPNGETMRLLEFPGADRGGAAGTPVDVNTHFWRTAGRSLLLTLSGAAAGVARHGAYEHGEYSGADALADHGGRQLDRRSRQMWDRGGYRGPTGTAKAGEVFLLQVTASMEFPGDYYEREKGQGYALAE